MIKTFDVETERHIDPDELWWPEPGEAMDDSALAGNRCYTDLRRLSWRLASDMIRTEDDLLREYESLDALPEDDQQDSDEEDDPTDALWFIDRGVTAAVVALSAARCIPCSSCNGGAFGGHHYECHPLVAFYAKPQHVPLLLRAAEESDVGLSHGPWGTLTVYSGDIRRILQFAKSVLSLRSEFRHLRFRDRRKNNRPMNATGTLPLFEDLDLQ